MKTDLGTEHLYNKIKIHSLSFNLSVQAGGVGGGTVVGLVTQGSSMSCRDTEVGEKKIKLIGHSSQKFTPGEEVYGALERKDSKDISHRIIAGKEKSELTGEQ